MDQIPCPDGYLMEAHSPLAEGHHTLNQYLVRFEEAGWQPALKEINGIRNKARKLAAWKAMLERMIWLRDNNRTSQHVDAFRGLAERIEKWTVEPTETDLIEILTNTAEASDFLAPYTPMPHLMDYIETHGLTADLAAAIRAFRARVYDLDYAVNQTSLQLFRSRLEMLAWRDEWTPVDPKRCWSEQIREDFRAMQGKEREDWRRLLYSIHGDESGRPIASWLEQAEGTVDAIGREAFHARVGRWLQTLEPGKAQRLSREGSFILRSLIWIVEVTRDPALLAKMSDIQRVDFKPKSNGQKVIRAAAEAAGVPDPTLRPAAAAPTFASLAGKALAAALSPGNSVISPELAGRISISGETIHVRGSLDTYQVDIPSGTAFRNSDGANLQISKRAATGIIPGLPDFGGIAELVRTVLVLANDAEHRPEFDAATE